MLGTHGGSTAEGGLTLSDLLQAYIADQGSIAPTATGRIQMIQYAIEVTP